MKKPLLLFMALFAGPSMAAERQEAVPARFVGERVADLKHHGDSRLRLDADRSRESGGPIRVVARGDEALQAFGV